MAAEGSGSKVAAEEGGQQTQLAAGLTAAWLWLGHMEERKKDAATRRQVDPAARLGRKEKRRKGSERRAERWKRQTARSGAREDSRAESVRVPSSVEAAQEADEAELRQLLAAAEARAAAAEAAVVRLREEEAQTQDECKGLRALLQRILEAARCPIDLGPFRVPVVASDGRTYSRRAIELWRRHGQHTSPLTREPLERELYTNRFADEVLGLLREMGLDVADDDGAESSASSQDPEDAEPEESTLERAITMGDEAAALELLRQPQVPGLNDVSVDGETLLHYAILEEMPEVALAIVERDDFEGINATVHPEGWTALHAAAWRGYLPVCREILNRADFTALLAVDHDGHTAALQALVMGNLVLRDFLRAAETRLPRAPRRP